MTNANFQKRYTSEFKTNFKIDLKSLIVDVDPGFSFDIYDFFQIKIPPDLIENWDSNEQIPFVCEAQCILLSHGKSLTPTITLTSEQHCVMTPSFPKISIMHNVSRIQHSFFFEDGIAEFPIFYSELPRDTVLMIKFFASLFQTTPKLIGTIRFCLFSNKDLRLRTGPYTLGFNEIQPTAKSLSDLARPTSATAKTKAKKFKSALYKNIRSIMSGSSPFYELHDEQIKIITESLHPDDAVKYFQSLYTPNTPPKLSNSNMFIQMNIVLPSNIPLITVYHSSLNIKPLENNLAANPFHLYKKNNSEILAKIFSDIKSPLAEITNDYKNIIRANIDKCLKEPSSLSALFRSLNWSDLDEVKDLENRLEKIELVKIEYALEFFTSKFDHKIIRQFGVQSIGKADKTALELYIPQLIQSLKVEYSDGLGDILIERSKDDLIFASKVYWISYCDDDQIIKQFRENLMEKINRNIKASLVKQKKLIDEIYVLLSECTERGKPKSTQEKIKNALNSGNFSHLCNFSPIPLPIDPTFEIIGIDPNDVKAFQSNFCPCVLSFKTINNGNYRVLFKIGDDMRQDQLILQLFEVMDHIFKSRSMELQITTYPIYAFSQKFGCCQFIEDSKAIFDIAEEEKITIKQYFLKYTDKKFGEEKDKIDKYIRSLAGYLVMTYVLLVGDRHDNNILIKKDGRLLHIDFGFVFGENAKPFSPPVKLRKGMLSFLGDTQTGLNKVMEFAGPAYNALRREARLILTLIELMLPSNLPCLSKNPDYKLHQVEKILMINSSDSKAMNSLRALFTDAINSKAQGLWDKVHKIAVNAGQGNAD